MVFFLGGGFLELVSGHSPVPPHPVALWLQVPDVDAEHERLTSQAVPVTVTQAPATQPWGLRECWIVGPDDTQIVLVEVPVDHPLRRRVD